MDFLERLNAVEEELIASRFAVEHEVGLGPTGIVYRVVDRTTNQHVALKVLRRMDFASLGRFAAESKALWTMHDPHVVRYVAHGVSEEAEPWVAMDWVQGESLAARLGRDRLLRIADVVILGMRLAHALATVHAHGMVHRNLKPANVLLVDGRIDQPKLVDFGIGRPTSAPEHTTGVVDLDGRSDLYAFGTLLFRCLTGADAFDAKTALGALAKALLYEPKRVSSFRNDIPRELDDLVAKMLSTEREARPPSAAVIGQALARIAAS